MTPIPKPSMGKSECMVTDCIFPGRAIQLTSISDKGKLAWQEIQDLFPSSNLNRMLKVFRCKYYVSSTVPLVFNSISGDG